ncbi:MAG: glycerol-3-phosphate acyltransferase [Candidatus Bathyarchaeia archaeon]
MVIPDLFSILLDALVSHQLQILFMLLFYVYGSIPFAFIFAYITKGERIYEKRTRNVGVANAFLVGGLTAGFLTVAGESSKALFPLLIASYFFSSDLTASLILILSASLGTSFPIFLKGKGGMGSTILIWTLLILAPLSVFVLAAVWGLSFKITGDSYRSSLIQNFSLPVVLIITTASIPLSLFGLLKSVIFITRFDRTRDEIARLSLGKNGMPISARKAIFPSRNYIVNLADAKQDSQIGKRATSLRFLVKNGFRVPKSHVCGFAAYEQYLQGKKEVLGDLRREIELLTDTNIPYSVVPSPSIEDESDSTFGERFISYSNIKGVDGILDSLERLWESAGKSQAASYLDETGKSRRRLKMAVIIQEMVPAECSGVVFTKNPMNGRDEITVEAVVGFTKALAQERTTPRRWVYKWGEWIEKPEDREFDFRMIEEVVRESKKIERRYRKPSCLEWAHDGKHIYWLQLKEVTSAKRTKFYSNNIPKEFFPGIIKPLIWSIDIPMINGAWIQFFSEVIGNNDLDPNELAKSFYYRAYFNMGIIGEIFNLLGMPREALELLIGYEVAGPEKPRFKPSVKTLKYLPRMIIFAIDKIMFSGKIEKFLESQREIYDSLGEVDIGDLDEQEMIEYIDMLYKANEKAAYLNIVTQLLNSAYSMAFRRLLEKDGMSVEKIDFSRETGKYRDIDPNHHLSILHGKYNDMLQYLRLENAEMSYQSLSKIPGIDDFKKDFDKFLSKFGHLSDSSNDFSSESWMENPELVLKMIANYAEPDTGQYDKVDVHEVFKGTFKRFFTRLLYERAAKYMEYKERVSFLFTYGFSLFRPYFLQLGEIFSRKGLIEEQDDIFFFELDEIKNMVNTGSLPEEYGHRYMKRKEEIEKYRDIELPDVIYGDDPPDPLTRDNVFNRMKGIAASKGYYRGRITVVKGFRDFDKVKDGDVLVIPHSDVSWTPLFAKAKAVICESGGILSHSAIVAREYNIPAVVSVRDACKLKDDSIARVDGYNGEVFVIN